MSAVELGSVISLLPLELADLAAESVGATHYSPAFDPDPLVGAVPRDAEVLTMAKISESHFSIAAHIVVDGIGGDVEGNVREHKSPGRSSPGRLLQREHLVICADCGGL